MKHDGPVGIAIKTATTGVGAKLIADTTLLKSDIAFATEYTAILASGQNTSYDQDARFKLIFDQWWINNMKIQQSKL